VVCLAVCLGISESHVIAFDGMRGVSHRPTKLGMHHASFVDATAGVYDCRPSQAKVKVFGYSFFRQLSIV
jgi:hypothetical protein